MRYIVVVIISIWFVHLIGSCTPESTFVVACMELNEDTVLMNDTVRLVSCSQKADEHLWVFEDNTAFARQDTYKIFTTKGRKSIKLRVFREPDGLDSITTYVIVEDPEDKKPEE